MSHEDQRPPCALSKTAAADRERAENWLKLLLDRGEAAQSARLAPATTDQPRPADDPQR
jgi:hypothetical protein